MKERDADFYDRLEKAGFQLDWGEDGSGLFMKYLRRGSGYYIDVGASELVASGDIKLKDGTVDHLTEDAVVMDRRHRAARRPRRLRDRLRVDERLGGGPHRPGGGRQGRQGLGPRLGHDEGPRAVGGRAAQHVEADAAGGAVVPRRQPAPVAPLLAVSSRSSSRRAAWASTRRSTGCRRSTTPSEDRRRASAAGGRSCRVTGSGVAWRHRGRHRRRPRCRDAPRAQAVVRPASEASVAPAPPAGTHHVRSPTMPSAVTPRSAW